jgi:hypothetical protein
MNIAETRFGGRRTICCESGGRNLHARLVEHSAIHEHTRLLIVEEDQ